jgi:hypothetical protein
MEELSYLKEMQLEVVKAKAFPVHPIQAQKGSTCIAPLILYLSPKW